ncbi:MAG: Uma2 family endonuclease [Deltaproteobacteria bacterium]|nr:Uma2 family endonuclease [Candidatus Anaeroferrophillacea bacterium]
MTPEEYLAAEAASDVKHEYIRGEIFAMAGAGDAHVTITLNVASALKAHLRGGDCRAFIADMKLRVEASDAFFYPDVFVTCGEAARQGRDAKTDALLIVEVLSPATAAYDRGMKFAHYRQIPGLQEYLLIDPAARTADLYRKGSDGLWVLRPYAAGDTLELATVNLSLSLDTVIFEDVIDQDDIIDQEPEPPETAS